MEITASKVHRDSQGRGSWCSLPFYIFSFFTNFIWSEIQAQKMNFAVMRWMWPKDPQHSWSHWNEVQMAEILQQQPYRIWLENCTICLISSPRAFLHMWGSNFCSLISDNSQFVTPAVVFYMWIKCDFVGLVLLYTYNQDQEINPQCFDMEFPLCVCFLLHHDVIKDYIRSYHLLVPLTQRKKEEVNKGMKTFLRSLGLSGHYRHLTSHWEIPKELHFNSSVLSSYSSSSSFPAPCRSTELHSVLVRKVTPL